MTRRAHCGVRLHACKLETQPMPAQQCSFKGHESSTVLHMPVSHTGREQVVVPPPLIACGVGPPPVVATTQSVSWQH